MAVNLKLNVVQVDKRHQKTSLRLLLEAVRSSSFIALDLELSGLGDKRGLNTRCVVIWDRDIYTYTRTSIVSNLQ